MPASGSSPSQLKEMTLAEARKICFDYTSTGVEIISKLPRKSASEPFRFIYVSGANSERDQMKKPWVLGDYCLMRVCSPHLDVLQPLYS
ncbi:hypothetical protein OCU04_012490 [Sclerotinia nivalis]|uniref:Uncharacterized protein n=1 Tax=Sclerotinia nivalis TaxID=352851 RepID=A0A9X0A8S3_9HELO|nr:hypothetical protein OCU04_012490 [Sclerotinia nivalis]